MGRGLNREKCDSPGQIGHQYAGLWQGLVVQHIRKGLKSGLKVSGRSKTTDSGDKGLKGGPSCDFGPPDKAVG